MTALAVEQDRRDATRRAGVRLKPVEYVQLYGPPAQRCSGCHHKRPDEHRAGGRLDRLVLEDLATGAAWGRDGREWGDEARRSVPEIAKRIGYSERSVQYALRRLEFDGDVNALRDAKAAAEARTRWAGRGRYVDRVERDGFTTWYRICRPVEPVDEWADVRRIPVRNRSRRRNTGPPPLHQRGATVAPELGTEQDLTPVGPDAGRLSTGVAAAAAAQAPPGAAPAGPPVAARGDASRSPTAPRRAHRSDAGPGRALGVAPVTLDGLADVALAGVSGLAPPVEGDSTFPHESRARTRQRRCPRCDAGPEQRCRRRDGREREANHRERRAPRARPPAPGYLRSLIDDEW